MGEAQGVSEQPGQSDTAPLAANPAEEAPHRHSGRGIRLLATVGAIVLAYAMWLP